MSSQPSHDTAKKLTTALGRLFTDSTPWFPRTVAGGACLIGSFILGACALATSHQVKTDHQQLREVLMDYVDDQIMDNLIRAYNGYPITHFDFSHVSALVTSKLIPQVAGGRSVTDVSNKAPNRQTVTTNSTATQGATTTITKTVAGTVAAIGGAVETIAKPFAWGVGAERDNSIDVEVSPVLENKALYAAYVNFLNHPEDEPPTVATIATSKMSKEGKVLTTTTADTLIDESGAPIKTNLQIDFDNVTSLVGPLKMLPPDPDHKLILIWKKWNVDKQYYYVPKDYKAAFSRLALATVARSAPSKSTDKAAQQEQSVIRQQLLMSQ